MREVVNNAGQDIEHLAYDAYGNVIANYTPQTGAALTTLLTRYTYTGREFDSATGLSYNRARWYDPVTGRWISEDPIGFAAGDANLYRYVGNEPTNGTDPSGHILVMVNDPQLPPSDTDPRLTQLSITCASISMETPWVGPLVGTAYLVGGFLYYKYFAPPLHISDFHGPYKDPDPPGYDNGAIHEDHKKAKSLGGSDAAENKQELPCETNLRKGGHEGRLSQDRQSLIDLGLEKEKVDEVLEGEINSLGNSPPPRPMDPKELDKLPLKPFHR